MKISEGKQSFPLEKHGKMSASVREGATVTAEIDETGSVIDVQTAKHSQLDPEEQIRRLTDRIHKTANH